MASNKNLLPGMHCMCYHPQHAWVPGIIDGITGKNVSVNIAYPAKEKISNLVEEHIFVCDEAAMAEDINDLLNLSVLHDGTLLNCLRIRYFSNIVYTNIGTIVVAINPFNFSIPWYMEKMMPEYLAEGEVIERNLPHSWAVAHMTYYEMRRDCGSQCILVSGESGAGKTEAAKIVMKYLAALSALQCSDEEKKAGEFVGLRMMQSNPILEAFGNAKTVHNDNSSRFGKLMRLKFNNKGVLRGADVTKYVLEKSRIITAAQNERVYHAFYLLLKGPDRERYGLEELSNYRSVMSGNAPEIADVDDAAEYKDVITAMGICGISEEDINSVWRTVGGVVSLLNVNFVADSADTCSISPETERYVTTGCDLLGISKEELKKELTTTTLKVPEGQVVTSLTKNKAIDARDSFCKAIYDNLFGHLVTAINNTIDTEDCTTWVALLDIFGFENFKVNSFEQLCINLANEALQRHYNNVIFTRDMEECKEEGIDTTQVVFPDNSECIDLISGKGGILSILDEDCLLAKSTDITFLDKITDRFGGGKCRFFERPSVSNKHCFSILHYASKVTYEVDGFIEKNRDTLKDAFALLLRNSSDKLIKSLLPMPVKQSGKSRYTVGRFFRMQLKDLIDLINSVNPHWIRCIKPHKLKKPLHFDGVHTLKQLQSCGVLATVHIRKAGYPIRIKISDFLKKYKVIVSDELLNISDVKESIQAVFKRLEFDDVMAQIGKTRVFLKSDAYQKLEVAKKQVLQVFARNIVCGALVSLSQIHTAVLLRNSSANIIHSFIRARESQVCCREREYDVHKEELIASFTQMLKLHKYESEMREVILNERDIFYSDFVVKCEELMKQLREKWHLEKIRRAKEALEELVVNESRVREIIETDEAADLQLILKTAAKSQKRAHRLEREREMARRRDEQRRAAAALLEAREKELQRLRDGVDNVMAALHTSLTLKKQESVRHARQLAKISTPRFCSYGLHKSQSSVAGIDYSFENSFHSANSISSYGSFMPIYNSQHNRSKIACSRSISSRNNAQQTMGRKECSEKRHVDPESSGSLDILHRLRSLNTTNKKTFGRCLRKKKLIDNDDLFSDD